MGDQNEATKVIGIVVAILLFLVVMAAVVGLVMWGTGKLNTTQSTVQDQVDALDSAIYTAYDEVEVSGSDIMAACKTYKNSDMLIVVSTKKHNSDKFYDTADPNFLKEPGTYYALGTGAEAGTGKCDISYDATAGYFTATVSGSKANNAQYSTLSSKANDACVNSSGRFWASLIYDKDTSNVAGILFRQTK